VFPTFMSSAANLCINGILPIDQLRDHIAPMDEVHHHPYPLTAFATLMTVSPILPITGYAFVVIALNAWLSECV
jgi:hypothetical protein